MNFDNNEQCFVVIILCSSAELQNFMRIKLYFIIL